jgi:serine/threonine-protein kinase
MKPAVGDLVRGKYRIQRLIGDGGMGSVFEARHEALGTDVALKFLHTDLARRPGLAARFAREARVAASIQSPHVTRVNDVDSTEDGTPFIVMELLQGQSLAAVLAKEPNGRLTVDEAVDFGLQILAGLEAAHARGIVHRDLKPDNVFVTPSPGGPVIKLFDFGIAKIRESKEFSRGLTHAGILMGTPEYMAPEQLYSAAGVDHRADLYSLGVMLFEMLSGRLPAEGESAAAIVAQVQQGTATRLESLVPELPGELVSLVQHALAPDPEQRFESAFAMRQALARFAGNLSHAGQLAAARTSVTTPPQPPQTSHASGASSILAHGASRESAAPTGTGALPDTVPPAQRPATVLTPAPPVAYDPLRTSTPALAPFGSGAAPVLPPRKRRSGALPWILGSLAALLGGAVGIVAYQQQRTSDHQPPPLATPGPNTPPEQSPSPEVDAKAPSKTSDVPASSTTAETPRGSTPAAPGSQPVTHQKPPAQKPSEQGTGGKSGSDPDTQPGPFGIPLPLPSTLPPLPSTLPPLPDSLTSALPTSFPPIFQQPPETPNQQPAKPAD